MKSSRDFIINFHFTHLKASISYVRYHGAPYRNGFGPDPKPGAVVHHRKWKGSEVSGSSLMQFPRRGHKKSGPKKKKCQKPKKKRRPPKITSMVTERVLVTSDYDNACRVMTEFPPEVCTGDCEGFNLRIPDKVFKSLRFHSQVDAKHRLQVADKSERTTCEQCLYPPTTLLFKLLGGGKLGTVKSILGAGKEAVVLHAFGVPDMGVENQTIQGAEYLVIPDECAIKIFRTSFHRFKAGEKYIMRDCRFKEKFSKDDPCQVLNLWAKKEMENLMRISEAGIPCPKVMCLKKHILVMSFIGDGVKHRAAPKLKDAILKPEQYLLAYNQVVDAMVKLFRIARLVHGDLSEHNLLWQYKKQRCVMIDVAQAVEASAHPQVLSFLLRDCENVSSFFQKNGVKEAMSAKELFIKVAGWKMGSRWLRRYGNMKF